MDPSPLNLCHKSCPEPQRLCTCAEKTDIFAIPLPDNTVTRPFGCSVEVKTVNLSISIQV